MTLVNFTVTGGKEHLEFRVAKCLESLILKIVLVPKGDKLVAITLELLFVSYVLRPKGGVLCFSEKVHKRSSFVTSERFCSGFLFCVGCG